MDNKTKRDIEERTRVPYDPKIHDLKYTSDAKAVTMSQLNGKRRFEELTSL